MRGFGVLFLLIGAGCASPDGATKVQSSPKGPSCGHGALDSDVHNCGECGHDCTKLAGVASATCFQGQCKLSCQSGRAHCSSNPDDGCEADLSAKSNCGACGNICDNVCAPSGGGFACDSSCGANTIDCGGQCADVSSDSKNCGACGQACPSAQNGTTSCNGGQCAIACDPGFALENGNCVSTQPANPTWTPIDSGSFRTLYGVWGSPSGDVFVIGDRGTVVQAPRGGTFNDIFSYSSDDIFGIWGVDSDHLLSVGWNTYDGGGAVFRPLSDGSWDGKGIFKYTLSSAWGSDFDHVYIVGDGGLVLHAQNGHTWADESGATTQHLWGVWGVDENNLYAAGKKGVILHKQAGSWKVEPSGGTTELFGIWGASATDVWVVGAAGTILHSAGDGKWAAETSGTTKDLLNVGGFGSDVYAVGADGTILHRSGGTWAAETSGTTDWLYGVWGSAMDGVFAVGENGTIVHK